MFSKKEKSYKTFKLYLLDKFVQYYNTKRNVKEGGQSNQSWTIPQFTYYMPKCTFKNLQQIKACTLLQPSLFCYYIFIISI